MDDIPMVFRRPNNPFLERQGMLRPQSAQPAVTTPAHAGGIESRQQASSSSQVGKIGEEGKCAHSMIDSIFGYWSSLSIWQPRPGSAAPTTSSAAAALRGILSPAKTVPKQPTWVLNDREVLRYYAYFMENVYEGGDENKGCLRLRKFSICYYTDSETFSMEEPREPNSGRCQGTFMRKQKVEKSKKKGGASYGPTDFAVGGTVDFYGR